MVQLDHGRLPRAWLFCCCAPFCTFQRRLHLVTVKRWFILFGLLTVAFIVYTSYRAPVHHPYYRVKPAMKAEPYFCYWDQPNRWKSVDHSIPSNHKRIDAKVLLIVEKPSSRFGKHIAELLAHNRIKFRVESQGKSPPVLANGDRGRFSMIIFENFTQYLHMEKWNKNILDDYCREFGVGIAGFMPSRDETYVAGQLSGAPLFIDTNVKVKDGFLNEMSQMLRLTRAGGTAWGMLPNEPSDLWTVFSPNHSTYEAVMKAYAVQENEREDSPYSTKPVVTVILDKGLLDGVRKVIFGGGLKFWLHRLLLIDAASYLSRGKLSVELKRYVLVDIDDIFVGETGSRMKKDDVKSLIDTQERIQWMIPGFKFNLGFSGRYFHHGTDEEDEGDSSLIEHSNEFMWFPHMWKHIKPHLYSNTSKLIADMVKNKKFAKQHEIPYEYGYSVAPHHSGVYPVHEELYEAWKKVWGVEVTSTEEYPHLRPARLRRGFQHRGIMVLPRQTCGLFTHTIFYNRYPGGPSKLKSSIQGGELFQTIVYNVVNVFMTHMPNYGNDRLAQYTFESVFKFIQCWTNLQLMAAPPTQLAEKYFKLYPEEKDPIWGNPCDDARHKKIWSPSKSCDSLPQFLVIGPQKTGTTALYTFLSMHPSIESSKPSPETFEEVQFFNGKNYYRGLDWYLKFFNFNKSSLNTNENDTKNVERSYKKPPILFEKSATYFDNELVPKRAAALLPQAKLVTILISPAKRAHSWYQHMRAHNDPVAINYTFYEILTASLSSPKALRDLKNRCLGPGRYAQHLERWLSFYSPQQILILDGVELRNDPVTIMFRVQQYLQIDPVFDYSRKLRYDERKGFYCQIDSRNRSKCLGKGKGRFYPPIDEKSMQFLKTYYAGHNTQLVKILRRLDQPLPIWLKEEILSN